MESFAYLQDPACGIPCDVHFEIEDEEGSIVGVVGGHKTVLALKSPVFKAMLFGPLAETGDSVKINRTSLYSFKEMLHYMHDAEMTWLKRWSLDLKEMFRLADLAERYNLPGLSNKLTDYANECLLSKKGLLEIARLAEDFHMFSELSEALLNNCVSLLEAILETPEDFNNLAREWSGVGEAEKMATALRLLARVDHWNLTYVIETEETFTQKIISHVRQIWHSILPRHRLQQLRMMLDEDTTIDNLRRVDGYCPDISTFSRSLWICQLKDEEKAELEGIPLTLDTLVEGGFTYSESIRLHLETISIIMREEQEMLCTKTIDNIWQTMLGEESNSIAGAKSMTLAWFNNNPDIFDRDHIGEKLRSCGDNVKELPEYNDACDLFM